LKGFTKGSRKAQKKAAEINGLTQGQGDGDTHGRVRKINRLGAVSLKRPARIAPPMGAIAERKSR
jgi:hypothetical protein